MEEEPQEVEEEVKEERKNVNRLKRLQKELKIDMLPMNLARIEREKKVIPRIERRPP